MTDTLPHTKRFFLVHNDTGGKRECDGGSNSYNVLTQGTERLIFERLDIVHGGNSIPRIESPTPRCQHRAPAPMHWFQVENLGYQAPISCGGALSAPDDRGGVEGTTVGVGVSVGGGGAVEGTTGIKTRRAHARRSSAPDNPSPGARRARGMRGGARRRGGVGVGACTAHVQLTRTLVRTGHTRLPCCQIAT